MERPSQVTHSDYGTQRGHAYYLCRSPPLRLLLPTPSCPFFREPGDNSRYALERRWLTEISQARHRLSALALIVLAPSGPGRRPVSPDIRAEVALQLPTVQIRRGRVPPVRGLDRCFPNSWIRKSKAPFLRSEGSCISCG